MLRHRVARPAYGRQLARAITGSRLVEIADAGHGVTIQRASEINYLLSRHFLQAERSLLQAALTAGQPS